VLGLIVALPLLLFAVLAAVRDQQEREATLAADQNYLETVLRDGAERARSVATQTMDRVRRATGLR